MGRSVSPWPRSPGSNAFSPCATPCTPYRVPPTPSQSMLGLWRWHQGQGEQRDAKWDDLVPEHACAEAFIPLPVTLIRGD